MMALRKLSALVFGLLVLTSVQAYAEEPQTSDADAKSEKTCFWLSSIDDFRAIDNRHVYLKGVGQKRKYLATLFSSCYGVRFTESIALSSRPTSRICSNSNDYLHVFDHGSSPIARRCLISNIEPVESLDAARALVEERKEAKEKAKQELENVSALDQDDAHCGPGRAQLTSITNRLKAGGCLTGFFCSTRLANRCLC